MARGKVGIDLWELFSNELLGPLLPFASLSKMTLPNRFFSSIRAIKPTIRIAFETKFNKMGFEFLFYMALKIFKLSIFINLLFHPI